MTPRCHGDHVEASLSRHLAFFAAPPPAGVIPNAPRLTGRVRDLLCLYSARFLPALSFEGKRALLVSFRAFSLHAVS